MEKLKETWWLRRDLNREQKNKLIIAETIKEAASRFDLVTAIQSAPNKEIGERLLERFFIDSDFSVETLARAMRSSKQELKEAGYSFEDEKNGHIESNDTYDELLKEINNSITHRDSSLEYNFSSYLRRALPNYHFSHNAAIGSNGQKMNVDFICNRYGLVIEVDGYEYHRDLHSFIQDRQRARKALFWGYTYLQFAASELTVKNGFNNAALEIKEFIKKKQ